MIYFLYILILFPNMDEKRTSPAQSGLLPELELTNDDILDAMRHIPGYLDISTEDFRAIYHLAWHHARGRLFSGITAGRLMRAVAEPLAPGMTMDVAAQLLSRSGFKSLPVLDDGRRVLGVLTETDFLRRLKADSFLELLLRLIGDPGEFSHRCHETLVQEVMSQPAITVSAGAALEEILQAFSRHAGRSMPVVADDGRLLGVLLRKDILRILEGGGEGGAE